MIFLVVTKQCRLSISLSSGIATNWQEVKRFASNKSVDHLAHKTRKSVYISNDSFLLMMSMDSFMIFHNKIQFALKDEDRKSHAY